MTISAIAVDPEEIYFRKELAAQVEKALETLSPRERTTLSLRFGFIGDSIGCTLKEVGDVIKVGRERVRQIEAKALRKLRHPCRSQLLKPYTAKHAELHFPKERKHYFRILEEHLAEVIKEKKVRAARRAREQSTEAPPAVPAKRRYSDLEILNWLHSSSKLLGISSLRYYGYSEGALQQRANAAIEGLRRRISNCKMCDGKGVILDCRSASLNGVTPCLGCGLAWTMLKEING